MRYILAEEKEPNFVKNGSSGKFFLEIFFYFYYAGHGCSDGRQLLVLNGTDV